MSCPITKKIDSQLTTFNLLCLLECRNNQGQNVKATEDNQTYKIVRTRDDIHKLILNDEDLKYGRHQRK